MTSSVDFDAEFRQFAARFAPSLLGAACALLSDRHLAEDAVQVTLLGVYRCWDRAREAPQAYSRRALVNVCRDQWRRTCRRPVEVDLSAASEEPAGGCFVAEVERRDMLGRALGELPQLQREVLTLRYYFDLSVEQSADILGIAEGTAKSATSRGLERLRHLLAATVTSESSAW